MRRAAIRGPHYPFASIWGAKMGAVMTLAVLMCGCTDNPTVHGAATTLGLATTPKEGPDWVRQSKPANPEYTSVGIEPAHPPDTPRDKPGVKQLQNELYAQRDAGHSIISTMGPQVAARQGAPPTADPRAVEAGKLKAQAQAAERIRAATKKSAEHGPRRRDEDKDKAPQ